MISLRILSRERELRLDSVLYRVWQANLIVVPSIAFTLSWLSCIEHRAIQYLCKAIWLTLSSIGLQKHVNESMSQCK